MTRCASAVASAGCAMRDLHDGELVAAHAGDGVGLAHQRAQPIGHHLQQLVAGRMAERVVDVS